MEIGAGCRGVPFTYLLFPQHALDFHSDEFAWLLVHANRQVHPVMQGWSAFAAEPIAAESFVCQYAGELLSSAETRQRLSEYDAKADGPGHALLVDPTPCLPSQIPLLLPIIMHTRRSGHADCVGLQPDSGRAEIVPSHYRMREKVGGWRVGVGGSRSIHR